MTMIWMLHVRGVDLGFLPGFLDANDPAPAREQLHNGYSANGGGGWRPFTGHTLLPNNALAYPGDPVLLPLATTHLGDETIVLYESSWVAVIQRDRTFEVSRMD